MVKDKNLSNEVWEKNVGCSFYVLNRYQTKSVNDKGPQESWRGIESSMSSFKFVGYVSCADVQKELRKNLDEKIEKCIFVGYNEQYK